MKNRNYNYSINKENKPKLLNMSCRSDEAQYRQSISTTIRNGVLDTSAILRKPLAKVQKIEITKDIKEEEKHKLNRLKVKRRKNVSMDEHLLKAYANDLDIVEVLDESKDTIISEDKKISPSVKPEEETNLQQEISNTLLMIRAFDFDIFSQPTGVFNHSSSYPYISRLRAEILIWVRKILNDYKITLDVYSTFIKIFDGYISSIETDVGDLEIISLSAFLIACKFQFVDTKIKDILSFSYSSFKKEDFKLAEYELLKVINFVVDLNSPFELINLVSYFFLLRNQNDEDHLISNYAAMKGKYASNLSVIVQFIIEICFLNPKSKDYLSSNLVFASFLYVCKYWRIENIREGLIEINGCILLLQEYDFIVETIESSILSVIRPIIYLYCCINPSTDSPNYELSMRMVHSNYLKIITSINSNLASHLKEILGFYGSASAGSIESYTAFASNFKISNLRWAYLISKHTLNEFSIILHFLIPGVLLELDSD